MEPADTRLIGPGLTNRAVAGSVGLSPNAIGTQVRSIFRELGGRSRVQLANALHSREAALSGRCRRPSETPDGTFRPWIRRSGRRVRRRTWLHVLSGLAANSAACARWSRRQSDPPPEGLLNVLKTLFSAWRDRSGKVGACVCW
jgi:hypothetical protein